MNGGSVLSPGDVESTVVWSNVMTQCDSTLQLNIPVTIKSVWWSKTNPLNENIYKDRYKICYRVILLTYLPCVVTTML